MPRYAQDNYVPRVERVRILITGGAGYIGSHIAKQLHRAGHEPVVLDDLSTGHAANARWGAFIQGDLGDGPLVRRVLHQHTIEGVIHCAGSAYVGESIADPR